MANDASSGVGNSSAQTVDAHVHREWEGARKRSAAGGMKRSGSLCGRGCRSAEAVAWGILRWSRCGIIEKQLPAGKPHGSIGKQLHSAKQSTIGTSNVPNQQHRDAHPAAMQHREAATARDGAKHHREAAPQPKAKQHREEDILANNGAKWAGAEGVRGSNLACFLKNFVSNYIVIFLMMLFRVHL